MKQNFYRFDFENDKALAQKIMYNNIDFYDFLLNRVSTYIDLNMIDSDTALYICKKLEKLADIPSKWEKIGKLFSEYAFQGNITSVRSLKNWVNGLSKEMLIEAIAFSYEISPTNDIDTSFYNVKYLLKPVYMFEISKKFGKLNNKKIFVNKSTGDTVVIKKENDMYFIIAKTQEDIDRFKLFIEQLRASEN